MSAKNYNRERNHRSLRAAGKAITGTLLLLLVFSILGGCEINKPEMPTFDTSLTIPLGIERIDILEAIEDEDYLHVGDDGTLNFFIDGEPDTVDFDFELSADIGSQSIEQGLGNFELDAADPIHYTFMLGDIWAPASGVSNFTTIVPGFDIDVVSAGQDIPDIESAVMESGTLTVTITNNLPVPVSADSGPDQLILNLENSINGNIVAVITFPLLGPGVASTQSAPLAGVTLPDELVVRLAGRSPGSGGQVETVNGTDSIEIAAVFTDMVVSSALAVVGPQSFQSSFDTELPADYEITNAVIGSGSVNVELINNMPVPCTAVLRWNDLLDSEEQPLVATFDLSAGQTINQGIDFSNRILTASGTALTALTALVEITTPGSGTEAVNLTSDDGLTANLAGGSITFTSVTGIIPSYSIDLDPIQETIDLPDEMDGIELTAATMILHMANTSGVVGNVDMTLSGTSEAGLTQTLDVSRIIEAAAGRTPEITDIVLNQNNSNIVSFLNNMPEEIILNGSVNVGGDGSSGTVRQDDYAIVSWDIEAPMEVIITGSTIKGDPDMLDLDEDMQDMIVDHALGARIHTEILNHMPVGVQIRILASTDTLTINTDPLLAIGPLEVTAANVDPLTHTVSSPVISRPSIILSDADAKLFGTPGLYTIVEVLLPSTDGNPVRMLSTDYLEVHGYIEMDVEVNDEW